MKVIGIECGYSSMVVEIPMDDNAGVVAGDEVIFKDDEGNEEYGIIKYVGREHQEEVMKGAHVLRKATANDIQKVDSQIDMSKAALAKCQEVAATHKLNMQIFRAGFSFDGLRAYFMFTSEDRVDFRDLVKDLAKVLQKQINLRQIGPRDKAKIVGGYGKCGRELCCTTWLGKIESINMEMVRMQALESKGSSNLSGSCGKLLCCLKYEVEAYRDLRKNLPRIGSVVKANKAEGFPGGEGTVIGLDILNQKFKMVTSQREYFTVPVGAIDKSR